MLLLSSCYFQKYFTIFCPQIPSIDVPDMGRAWRREEFQPLTGIGILSSVPPPVTLLIVISAENNLHLSCHFKSSGMYGLL
jgi:hypothetical protein